MDDRLRAMARQALADIPPPEDGSSIVPAVTIRLRTLDGARRTLTEYAIAVRWAIEHPNAADLPDGSIVASQRVVFLKDHQVPDRPWSCTDGGHAPDEEIDRYLGLNARVLRVGTGEE